MVKLNLGCGDKILPGYVNVDAASSRAGRQPDFVADIRDLRKIKSSIADEILAVHVIEHFYYWEVVPLLQSWRRLLKPDGKLILECPNLLYACQRLLRILQCVVRRGRLVTCRCGPCMATRPGRIR